MVEIDSSSPTDAEAAISTPKQTHRSHSLDFVVASAGTPRIFPPMHEVESADMLEDCCVDVIAVARPP